MAPPRPLIPGLLGNEAGRPLSLLDRFAESLFATPGVTATAETAAAGRQQGLLQAGLSLLGSSGPSLQPRGLGADIAQAIGAGQQGFGGAVQLARSEESRAELQRLIEQGDTSPESLRQGMLRLIQMGAPPQIISAFSEYAKSVRPISGTPRVLGRIERGEDVIFYNPFSGEIVNQIKVPAKPSTGRPFEGFTETAATIRLFQTAIEPYREFSESYARMRDVAKQGTGVSDITVLTAFMKMVDEGSVVREAEFKIARQAAAWFERAKVWKDRVLNQSAFLTDETRAEFMKAANAFAAIATRSSESITEGYGDLFKQFNMKVPALIQDPLKRQGVEEFNPLDLFITVEQ